MKRKLLSALCVVSLAACAEEQKVVAPPPPPPPPVAVVAPPPEPPAPPPKPSLAELEKETLMTVVGGVNAHDAAKMVSGYADDALIRIASGERTLAETLGHHEFAPWRIGPVL